MRILFLVLALLPLRLWAAESDRKTGAGVIAGAVLEATGSRYQSSLTTPLSERGYWVEESYAIVRLSYTISDPAAPRPVGRAVVPVAVAYTVEGDLGFETFTTVSSLEIDLSTPRVRDIAFLKLDKAQKITAQVLAAGLSVAPELVSGNLALEVEVVTRSFEKLERDAISSNFTLSHEEEISADGNLEVSWTAIPGAEYYELEWTYVSDQHPTNPAATLAPSAVKVDRFLFRNNSSRVDVRGLSYQIPMIYERGIILYRLRGVGKNVADNRPVAFRTRWSVEDGLWEKASEFPHYFVFEGHERLLNWQSSLSFAEEGKSKLVVSYHDGSARNRQAVTRINTDQRSVVGETFYDYNGRPVIQLLPVPVTENAFSYYPNFNLIQGKDIVEKGDYDQAKEGRGCAPLGPVFSNETGASGYYSPANPFEDGGNTGDKLLNRDLVPDAQGYPYTQTVYTPDNTGRIAAQSGVGPAHGINSGHETRYLYAAPQQEELSRLFGAQVGYASRYKKNTVIDPNGQVSVSYLDLDGKVVATALAGNAPGSLSALEGDMSRQIDSELLGSPGANTFSSDSLVRIYNSKFAVTGTSQYRFGYDATLNPYTIACAKDPESERVYDPAVIVDVVITDKCADEKMSGSDFKAGGHTGASDVKLEIPEASLTEDLPAGEYQIVKILKIDEAKLEEYWADYLQAPNCLLLDQNFIDEERAKIDLRGCGITCQSCRDEVEEIRLSGDFSPAEIAGLSEACDQICDDEGIGCRGSLQAMLGDMSPGGQYGKIRGEKINQSGAPGATIEDGQPIISKPEISFNKSDGIFEAGDPDDDKIDASPFPYSVFNLDNKLRIPAFLRAALSDNEPSYRYPLRIKRSPAETGPDQTGQILFNEDLTGVHYEITNYTDKEGAVFYVYVRRDGEHSYQPALWSDSQVELLDAETGLSRAPVRFLANLADFEKYWMNHWANYLVAYHPEYEYLIACSRLKDSHDFDYGVADAAAVDIATDKKYLVDGIPNLLDQDPYFAGRPLQKSVMRARINKFATNQGIDYSMVSFANWTVNCPSLTTDCLSDCDDGEIDSDAEWNVYKALYLSEKQKLARDEAAKQAVEGHYYNGCIGHADFMDLNDSKYMRNLMPVSTPVTVWTRSCAVNWNPLPKRNCSWTSHTVYRNAWSIQYLNPAQLCNLRSAPDYRDFTARFWPQVPGGVPGGRIRENCKTLVYDELDNVIEVSVPCLEDAEESARALEEEARVFKYESCGQCPLASDLEVLLMDLNRVTNTVGNEEHKKLLGTNEILTCDGVDFEVAAGMALRDALLPPGGGKLYWKNVDYALDGKSLTARFTDAADNALATVVLTLPVESSPEATFASIGDICCFQAITNGSDPSFTFRMGYYDQWKKEELTITGTYDYQGGNIDRAALAPCTFPPRCLLTDDAYRAVAFVNMLTFSSEHVDNKSRHLLTTGAGIELYSSGRIDFYNDALRALARKDDDTRPDYQANMAAWEPEWTSALTGLKLTGDLETSQGTIQIKICGLDANDYASLLEFRDLKALRPGDEGACWNDEGTLTSQPFAATATIDDSGVLVYKPVTIYLPSMDPALCRPVTAPSN